MNISVNHINLYNEIHIEDGNTKIVTELYDTEESIDVAKSLISVAEDLLPTHSAEIEMLATVRERL